MAPDLWPARMTLEAEAAACRQRGELSDAALLEELSKLESRTMAQHERLQQAAMDWCYRTVGAVLRSADPYPSAVIADALHLMLASLPFHNKVN